MRDQVIRLIERNVAAGEYRDRLLAHARGLDDDWYRGVHGDPFTAIVADYARHRLEPSSTPGGYGDLYAQLTAALETGGGRR